MRGHFFPRYAREDCVISDTFDTKRLMFPHNRCLKSLYNRGRRNKGICRGSQVTARSKVLFVLFLLRELAYISGEPIPPVEKTFDTLVAMISDRGAFLLLEKFKKHETTNTICHHFCDQKLIW